jgi:hypothetical protein
VTRLSASLLVRQAASRHLRDRAEQLSTIAKDLHRNAPRGGPGVNRFGELRSPAAGGTAPALETGGLFAIIDQGVTVDALEARVVVNFGFGPGKGSMETGTRRMRPRPLGALAVAELKARVP